jgi:hypothetical protein
VLRELPAKSVILDGEIVASDATGMPDFWRLFLCSAKPAELHVWAFDLLALNREDLRKWSLEARQTRPLSHGDPISDREPFALCQWMLQQGMHKKWYPEPSRQ